MSSILSTLAHGLLNVLAGASSQKSQAPESPGAGAPRQPRHEQGPAAGRQAGSQTVRVDPGRIDDLQVSYAPQRDGDPDAGEVIWTWVPYEEDDGRGKDRPVLVIGRASADRVYAVRMTSRAHAGDRDFLPIGSGAWDFQGRASWVDIEQLYSVHTKGMRREAAALDRSRYDRVARALIDRYGWARG